MTRNEAPASRVSRAGSSVVHLSGETTETVAKIPSKLNAQSAPRAGAEFPYDPATMTPRARSGSAQTSVLAAIEAKAKAAAMTQRIWGLLQEGPLTPEEAQAKLSESGERVLLNSVRARMCGLHKAGRVKDTGERGLGESQRAKAIRWRASTPQEYAAWLAARAGPEAQE